mmetsp:Transcript_30127/g.78189  ORF Transcript_30127/g.78189 Transcript_30127/m.78189 type:complete len:137 (+) Transcript_30127:638-1048(+)
MTASLSGTSHEVLQHPFNKTASSKHQTLEHSHDCYSHSFQQLSISGALLHKPSADAEHLQAAEESYPKKRLATADAPPLAFFSLCCRSPDVRCVLPLLLLDADPFRADIMPPFPGLLPGLPLLGLLPASACVPPCC